MLDINGNPINIGTYIYELPPDFFGKGKAPRIAFKKLMCLTEKTLSEKGREANLSDLYDIDGEKFIFAEGRLCLAKGVLHATINAIKSALEPLESDPNFFKISPTKLKNTTLKTNDGKKADSNTLVADLPKDFFGNDITSNQVFRQFKNYSLRDLITQTSGGEALIQERLKQGIHYSEGFKMRKVKALFRAEESLRPYRRELIEDAKDRAPLPRVKQRSVE